jgi:hypothetical protein
MRSPAKWLVTALIPLLLASCTPWRVDYLRSVANQATQDDIAKRLGAPHFEKGLTGGGSVWTYQYRGYAGDASYCTEYVLTFDEQKVLREWRRQGC